MKVPAGSGKLAEIGLVYPASRIHLMEAEYLNQILTGVIAACDARAVNGLLQETQVRREDLVVIGVSCGGVAGAPDPARSGALALKCHACDGEVPAQARELRPLHRVLPERRAPVAV